MNPRRWWLITGRIRVQWPSPLPVPPIRRRPPDVLRGRTRSRRRGNRVRIGPRLTVGAPRRRASPTSTRLRTFTARAAQSDGQAFKAALQERLEDWRGLLSRQVPQARQILKKLLHGVITFTPDRDGMRQGWRFKSGATFEKLLAGSPWANTVASPTGTALALETEIALRWEVAA